MATPDIAPVLRSADPISPGMYEETVCVVARKSVGGYMRHDGPMVSNIRGHGDEGSVSWKLVTHCRSYPEEYPRMKVVRCWVPFRMRWEMMFACHPSR